MRIINILLGILLLVSQGYTGLRTTFVEVLARNLKIGGTYCITRLQESPFPFIVENTTNSKIYLKIQPLRPKEERRDYLPIPDIGWVKIEPDFFEVEPLGKAIADIYLHIPDDESYLGKKYYFKIWSYTTSGPGGGGGMIGVGLLSRILFEVSKELPIPEFFINYKKIELKKRLKCGICYDINKKLLKPPLRIINKSEKDLEFEIIPSLPISISEEEKSRGYQIPESCYFLIPGMSYLYIKAHSQQDIPIYLAFPKKDKYRKKRFLLELKIKLLKYDIEKRIKFYLSLR
jgi:hypothetical protein